MYGQLAYLELMHANVEAKKLPSGEPRASRMMRSLYTALLDKMNSDGYKVYQKRYRLTGPHKAWVILKSLLS